jgi:hypothetical protein
MPINDIQPSQTVKRSVQYMWGSLGFLSLDLVLMLSWLNWTHPEVIQQLDKTLLGNLFVFSVWIVVFYFVFCI